MMPNMLTRYVVKNLYNIQTDIYLLPMEVIWKQKKKLPMDTSLLYEIFGA